MANGVEATARWNPLRGIYAWVMRQAEGRFAWGVMAAIAFAESSFLPIPPDLMLIPMTLANRKRAFWLAAWCTSGRCRADCWVMPSVRCFMIPSASG